MVTRRILQVLLCLLIAPFSISAQLPLGFTLANGQTRARIPIEIYNNLVVAPVILNGQVPLKFIIDTGVRTAILTDKDLSDFLNLTYSRKYTISGIGGEKLVDAYVATDVSLDIPGVKSRGHAMLVLDHDFLQLKNFLGADIHGILGYELFSRFIVQIDYQRKEMVLISPASFKPKRKYEMLPISIQDTKPYIVADVKINDTTVIRAKLLVDSGASHGLFLNPESDPRIKIPPKHVSSIIGRGIGGSMYGKIARVPSLALGKFDIKNVITNFPDPETYVDSIKSSPTVFRNGAIGGEVLSRFKVIFDFSAGKLYLQKNHSFKKKFYYNLSGLTIKATGKNMDRFEISDIREKSPSFKAGLLVGDFIQKINGFPSNTLNLNQVNDFFNSAPRRRLYIEVIRKGELLKKEFRLEDPI
jgi:hypothetical protein